MPHRSGSMPLTTHSTTSAPASTQATVFARPIPRSLWQCASIVTSLTERMLATISRIASGVATPSESGA